MRTYVVAIALMLFTSTAHAQFGPTEPEARMQLEDRKAYAGVPFDIVVVAEGFDSDPAPPQPILSVPGATVTAVGVEPSFATIVINGRRSDQVTWVFRWRVDAPTAGQYQVADVTVVQGAKKAVAKGGGLPVEAIETTTDMSLELRLPDRPVWVGETFTAQLDWILKRDVDDHQLSVPLLSMTGDLAVAAPPIADPRRALAFPAGTSSLELPFVQEKLADGVRIRFEVLVTPLRSGALEIAPSQVVASLQIGRRRSQLFRAADVARTLEVRPLPQTGRPASFAGAVGTSFSIGVRSSRSVVQLGEPVDLEITIKGETRLDGLALGDLAGAGRLPADQFAAPQQPPTGELSDDGKTKVFRVPVQVTDPATREIPPIELAWFDPASGQYRTTRSEPIALSIKGGTVVGAGDVVGGGGGKRAPSEPAPSDLSLVGADLALSAPGAALDRPLGGATLWALVAILYLVPIGVLGTRLWQRRTARRREEAGEVAAARKRLDAALADARGKPARDAAGPLIAALRGLARAAGEPADDPVLARIETESFAPGAAEQPLPEALCRDAASAAARWTEAARKRPARGAAAAIALVVPLVLLGASGAARAGTLDDGRAAYQQAMDQTDPTARQVAFARAAVAFGEVAAAHPDSPDLLADWGNAAMGAADFGTATLAFRRALRIDPDHRRAHRNLDWLRSRLPDNLRPRGGGAAATLFFFHGWTRGTRIVGGAIAFALAALLIVPWRRRAGGARVALAAVAAFAWIVLTASVLLDRGAGSDGVVLQAQVLRSADNLNSPAAMATPLPPGAEVAIVEQRADWTRVRTAGGATGWLPATAVAPVAP